MHHLDQWSPKVVAVKEVLSELKDKSTRQRLQVSHQFSMVNLTLLTRCDGEWLNSQDPYKKKKKKKWSEVES